MEWLLYQLVQYMGMHHFIIQCLYCIQEVEIVHVLVIK